MAKRRARPQPHIDLYWLRDPVADLYLLQDRPGSDPDAKRLLEISGETVDSMLYVGGKLGGQEQWDALDGFVSARVKRFFSDQMQVRMVKLSYFIAVHHDFGIWDNDPEKMREHAFLGGLTWVTGQYVLVSATLFGIDGKLLPRGPHHGQIVRPVKGDVFQVYIPAIEGSALVNKQDIVDWNPGPPAGT